MGGSLCQTQADEKVNEHFNPEFSTPIDFDELNGTNFEVWGHWPRTNLSIFEYKIKFNIPRS